MQAFAHASKILLVTFFLVTSHFSRAQNQFKHYTVDDGYTGPGAVQLAQDSLGFLWIKTGGGIFQFDGFQFKVKKANPNDSLSLPYDGDDDIIVDPKGQFWAYHGKSLRLYDKDNDGFKLFLLDTVMLDISFDHEGIWIGTYGDGLRKFIPDNGEIARFVNPGDDSGSNAENNIIIDIYDRGVDLVLASANGIWIFDKTTNRFHRPVGISPLLTAKDDYLKIFSTKNRYWIQTSGGLIETSSDFKEAKLFDFEEIRTKFDKDGNSRGLRIQSIAMDGEGVFWIGSRVIGLIRFDPNKNELENFRHDDSQPNSLMADEVNAVLVDRDQNIWVSEFQKGISILKKQSIKFNSYLRGKNVGGMEIVRDEGHQQLFVCAENGGLLTANLDNSRGEMIFTHMVTSPDINKFENIVDCLQGKDFLWVSRPNYGMFGIPKDPATGELRKKDFLMMVHDPHNDNTISGSQTTEFLEDRNGNLWVGTLNEGLNRINLSIPYGKKGSVIRYQHIDSDSTSINDGMWVTDLDEDENGNIWVCTRSGIDVYHDNIFEHISNISASMTIKRLSDGSLAVGTKSGLYLGKKEKTGYSFEKVSALGDAFISSLQEDSLHRLWLASLQGLFMYDRNSGYVAHFKEGDGVQGTRFAIAGTGSLQTGEGKMVFSGPNGISVFDPLSFHISHSKPRPVITALKINNKETTSVKRNLSKEKFLIPHHVNSLKDLELDYKQIVFTLEFSSMELTAPHKNFYRYRLDGFDEQWIETDWKNRTATYTNLDPGKYTFRLKASNYDGIWNDEETVLAIRILPPPWKTWWAYSIYACLLVGLLWFARRITLQRERLTSKLKLDQIALEKARELDRLKSTFFTNISHEFRTPLTLIKGPAQSLEEELSDNPRAVNRLKGIQQNADQLLKLINQLLELSRMESGTVTINNLESNLTFHLTRVAQSFSSHAFQKGVLYEVQGLSRSIVAKFDQEKLEVIVINLIINAIKFSKSGDSVLFKAAIRKELNRTSTLIITVTDTGIGIHPDESEKIFDRFYQINTSHHEIGTGIGLSLVKELTERLGGSIQVTSMLGSGSEFRVSLPIEIVQEYELETETSLETKNVIPVNDDDTEITSMNSKILVVEDNAALRRYVIELLGEEYEYLEAGNGKEGLQLSIDHVPELIITDVMMPEMDGIEMTSLLKKDIRTSHIPTLILTAKGTEEDKLTGLDQGADDYLTKPFNKSELVLKVKNALALRARLRERTRTEIESEAQPKVQTAEEKFLMRVRDAIYTRISDEQLSVESLAKDIGLSRVQLYRKITALTGLTVIDLIRSYRLQHAAKLLKRGDAVSHVAFEVGFSNHSHFSRLFKEKYGVLPSEYR